MTVQVSLTNWFLMDDTTSELAMPRSKMVLVGEVTSHPEIERGNIVAIYPLTNFDGQMFLAAAKDVIVQLEEPSVEFKGHLDRHDLTLGSFSFIKGLSFPGDKE